MRDRANVDYLPTALLAKRDAIVRYESMEVGDDWLEETLTELRDEVIFGRTLASFRLRSRGFPAHSLALFQFRSFAAKILAARIELGPLG